MKKSMGLYMRKMVKLLSFAFAMFLCTQTVHADVIWEPQNSFYEKHREECEIVGREYVANGPDGKVIVYKSPENALEVGTFENGESTWITWIYKDSDGILWGCPNKMENGWLPMDYMQVVYDYISFEEEYGSQFMEESGSVDEFYIDKSVYFWKYPGSENYEKMDLDPEWTTWMPEYHKTYVDEAGRKWGFCGYYYGTRNFWVCLDEPDADFEKLYGETISGEVITESDAAPIVEAEIVPKGNETLGLIGISVGVVVIVTGVILIKMKKKSRVQ